jgi:hypothetical protein
MRAALRLATVVTELLVGTSLLLFGMGGIYLAWAFPAPAPYTAAEFAGTRPILGWYQLNECQPLVDGMKYSVGSAGSVKHVVIPMAATDAARQATFLVEVQDAALNQAIDWERKPHSQPKPQGLRSVRETLAALQGRRTFTGMAVPWSFALRSLRLPPDLPVLHEADFTAEGGSSYVFVILGIASLVGAVYTARSK